MAAQLKINATSPVSLREMSGTDYDYTTYQILNTFAATDTGVGTLQLNPGVTTGLTSVGTFADTYYDVGAPGSHPVGTTITTTNYVFYQDLQTASESLTRPIEYSSGLKEQVDANLNADSITVALANLISNGVGSYAMTSSTPTGGTWTTKATIYNYNYTGSYTVTYLWRKTAPASVPSALRPLKINSTSPVSVKEMLDAEIQTLAARFRNQIVSTGKGQYQVATNAPVSGGTWVTQGTSFSDTRNTESSPSYNQDFTGSFTGVFTGTFTGQYTGAFSRIFTGAYTPSFLGAYSRDFNRVYTAPYTLTAYTRAYTGTFLGFYAGGLGYQGTQYLGSYTGAFSRIFTGAAPYTLAQTGYTGAFSRVFQGYYSAYYTGAYLGNYTGAFLGSFLGGYNQNFTGAFSRAFTGAFTGVTLDASTATISTASLWLRVT